MPMRALTVCLINPRFAPSFWGYDYALPLMPGDKRCWVVTGALPALAALAPAHCEVTLIDENVEPVDLAALACFDVVGVTGMVVQAERMKEILRALRPLGVTVVAGGPYVSVAEDQFASLCDVRFVGEADDTWPAFLLALGAGEAVAARYEQAERSDMRRVPVPRYDLIKADRYLMASLQFSRGCPFTCEFCDIITVFGRRPRLKAVDQMMAEFEAVRRAGFRLCFLVDDNLIGNKAEAKKLLARVAAWQLDKGFPLQLYAEASVNLAEDAELIDLLVRANVRQVFIGIESPRRASLAETKKIQNIRGDPLQAKIKRIRDGGLVVQAGFIVGFDSDDAAIFDDQFAFIQETGIAQALVAILSPIPTTPLHARLAAAGRLDPSDPDVAFLPAQMSRATLKEGYADLMRRLYEPEAYFGRLFAGLAGSPAFRRRRQALDDLGKPGRRVRGVAAARTLFGLVLAARLLGTLLRAGRLGRLGPAYLRAFRDLNRPLGPDALGVSAFVGLCVVHWHFFNVANSRGKGDFGIVRSEPVPVAFPAPAA